MCGLNTASTRRRATITELRGLGFQEVGFRRLSWGIVALQVQALLETVGTAAQKAETALIMFIDEMQYVAEDELAALIMPLHRCIQRKLPIALVGAGLPQLRGRMGDAKSYAERLFDFPEIGPLSPSAARIAIAKPATDLRVAFDTRAVEPNTQSACRQGDDLESESRRYGIYRAAFRSVRFAGGSHRHTASRAGSTASPRPFRASSRSHSRRRKATRV